MSKIQLPKYTDKAQLFDWLITNKADLIDLKKSTIKFADSFGMESVSNPIVIKSFSTENTDTDNQINRTIIGNTYNWMDSHDDVHLDGVFSDSIKQRASKIRHLHDHIYQLSARVGIPKQVYEKMIPWVDLGVNKMGSTMALFMDSEIKRNLNAGIFEAYKNGEVDQHSVGMRYSKIFLAVNNPDSKEEYATWNKYINLIGNKEKAEEKGFFWAVKEAALIEISGVLEGSNELTPTLDPSFDSQNKSDPALSSQQLTELINKAFLN